MAEHARFSVAIASPGVCYDPHSRWLPGSDEHTKRLLRQYSPAAPTSERSRKVTSTTSLLSSTAAPGKRSDGSHHVRHRIEALR